MLHHVYSVCLQIFVEDFCHCLLRVIHGSATSTINNCLTDVLSATIAISASSCKIFLKNSASCLQVLQGIFMQELHISCKTFLTELVQIKLTWYCNGNAYYFV